EVEKYRKQFERGAITDKERYNRVIDIWTEARDIIKDQLMSDLKNDRRDGRPYLNPIYLMAISGARGGIEQIRQLAGMRGLMAKPNGKIIETPVRANFKEGLGALEDFSGLFSVHQQRLDTAMRKADAAYLTGKLANAARDVVITMRDCGTTTGVARSAFCRGDPFERTLSEVIRGRVSCRAVRHPLTDAVIVGENEMLSWEA